MKKMLVMLAAVAMAACAQAETVRWDVVSSDAMGVYFIKGSKGPEFDVASDRWDELIHLFTTTLMENSWSDQLAAAQVGELKQFEDFGEGSFGLEAIYSFTDTYFAILATYDDANLTPGGSFNVYIADNTERMNTFNLSEETLIYSGNFGGEAIPEPTSGLLLLLGMAGLALKRKVA